MSSILEGMEIWLYLEHPHNVIKYQFIGFPVGQDGLTAGIDNAKAAVHDHLYTTHNCKHRAAPDTSQKGMNLFRSEANTAIKFYYVVKQKTDSHCFQWCLYVFFSSQQNLSVGIDGYFT